MVFAPDSPRVAWLFTRGRESVRIEAAAADGAARLVVKGPGPKRDSYEFPDMVQLIERQTEIEAQLIKIGYTLEQFNSDRRRWPR